MSANSDIEFTFAAEKAFAVCEAKLGESVRSTKNITSIANQHKTVYCVQFASGLRIKLYISSWNNRYWSEDGRPYTDAVGQQYFPRTLIRGERWAAYEWIEGKVLSQQRVNQDILNQAAHLLTAIHRAKVDPRPTTSGMTLDEVRCKLNERLPVLVSNGILNEAQSHRVAGLCDGLVAENLNTSLIHGDFSPSNLVLRGTELISIDNETMRLHVTEYDVSRAINIWDQGSRSGSRLLEIYAKHASNKFDYASLQFWGIFDLVYRISYRISSLRQYSEFFIGKLRRMLQQGTF